MSDLTAATCTCGRLLVDTARRRAGMCTDCELDGFDSDDDEWIECENCGGEGRLHDCGEDCCCLDTEGSLCDPCNTCDGHGGWRAS